jgi:hypothetical protein
MLGFVKQSGASCPDSHTEEYPDGGDRQGRTTRQRARCFARTRHSGLNDCHYMGLLIYNTLSDEGWDKACTSYFDQPSDHNRRGITRTRIEEVLDTENDRGLRDNGTQLLKALDKLAKERNLATHTMWASVPIHTMLTVGAPKNEIRPHPAVSNAKKPRRGFQVSI